MTTRRNALQEWQGCPELLQSERNPEPRAIFARGTCDHFTPILTRVPRLLVVVQLEFFSIFNHLQSVISKGVSESRVFGSPFAPAFGVNGQISGRVALRDLVFTCQNKRSLDPIRALCPFTRKNGAQMGTRLRALMDGISG